MGHCYVHFAFVFTLKPILLMVTRVTFPLLCTALSLTFNKIMLWSEDPSSAILVGGEYKTMHPG